MATLKVGRVGLASPTFEAHQDWRTAARERGTRHRISGWLQSTTLALTKILRTELTHQTGNLVAVTYTGDDSFDAMALLARDRLVTSLSESGLVRAIPARL